MSEHDDTYPDATGKSAPSWQARSPKPRQVSWKLSIAILAGAVLIAGYFVFVKGDGSSTNATTGTTPSTSTGKVLSYTVIYPKNWKRVAPDKAAPGLHAFAAVERTGGGALVVMRLEGKVTDLEGAYLKTLTAQLKKSIPDYKYLGEQMLKLPEGNALDLTYQRTKLHDIRNVVVLPVGDISIVMATIAPENNSAVTSELSTIVASFKINP